MRVKKTEYLDAVIHSFNCHFQDFGQRRQQMLAYGVLLLFEWTRYHQVEFFQLQLFDARRVAFRDKALLDFNKSPSSDIC